MGGGEWAPERQPRPDGQVAVFIASGKQMTERKPSAGMGNVARAGRAQIWVRTGGKPLPRARGCLRPGCASHAGSGVRGRGLRPGARPAGRPGRHPRGRESSARRSTNMQIYVNQHANQQHLFASAAGLGTFSGPQRRWRRARSSVAPGWGCGGRSGVRERFQRGRGRQRGSQPFRPEARAEAGAPRAHGAARGELHLVLSDVPLLQDDLSLPGRQLGLVVAQRPQLL